MQHPGSGDEPRLRFNRSIPDATVIPVLTYPDVRAAVRWLTGTFGFTERVRIGEDHRAQLSVGAGAVIVADTGGSREPADPAAITHSVIVRVPDARAQRDRAADRGAVIVMEPTDLPFGERQCTVLDPWGHHWTFSQTLADVAPQEWGGLVPGPWTLTAELGPGQAGGMSSSDSTQHEHHEHLKVRGEAMVATIKDIIHQGNVRRITVKNEAGHPIIEIPVTAGVVAAVVAPVLTAVAALAALAGNWQIEVERVPDRTPKD
jgi:uncharacterized glyoxalase superfamily protein PhnB